MSVTYVETRYIDLADLTPFPGNARRGDVDAIRESINRLGQYRSLIVRDEGDGRLVILAGNHTFQALAADGREVARCEIVRCDDDEAKRINLVDNRAAERGTYDDDALAELLSGLDGDFEGTGWTAEDLDHLVDSALPSGSQLPEEGDAPVTDSPTVWGVVVTCTTEEQQADLLTRLDGEGYEVRALL